MYLCGLKSINIEYQDEGTNGVATIEALGWKTKQYCAGSTYLKAVLATVASFSAMSAVSVHSDFSMIL